ncbi:neuraminidase-like domain-containing protein [Pseudomonas parafulva]|uniref:Tc toxin subunit A-related protein n=1 Tax=Pseudomonas parafulva TaxID=157782 RepID=UPI00054094EF|nr:neuraminidase-like domain-containing protein [Pseudomonas parafulva]AIZ32653.1 hypothetical protein NJ69_06375 [Pseudomonas parafulva]
MNTELVARLTEQWRDALSAYVIHHVMPQRLDAGPLNMISAEHLDHYFMLDTQVCAAVSTSYLAEAIACTQTYVNAIFNNLEPGYRATFDEKLVTFWRQGMSNYSVWAAYQMLEDYPENYIRADLRLDKTEPFQALEDALGQARISDASVSSAVLAFLRQYEFQNSIRVVSGYIDYRDEQRDGDHFEGYTYANSDYYLLGRDPEGQYYHRRVSVRLDQESQRIAPDAWSEWKLVGMPSGHTVIQARLVLLCGRLHLVWLHQQPPIEVEQDSAARTYPLRLEIIYLGLDSIWSTPELLWSAQVSTEDGNFDPTGYELLALAVAGTKGSDDQLLVACASPKADGSYTHHFNVWRDVLKRPSGQFDERMAGSLLGDFRSEPGKLRLQRRLSARDKWVRKVTAAADNDKFVGLDAQLSRQDDKYQLHVRSYSLERRNEGWLHALYCARFVNTSDALSVKCQVSMENALDAHLLCSMVMPPTFDELVFSHPSLSDPATFTRADFKSELSGQGVPFLIWVARRSVKLDKAMSLDDLAPQAVRDGVGFKVAIDAATPVPLSDPQNHVAIASGPAIVKAVKVKAAETELWTGDWSLTGAATSGWLVSVVDDSADEVKITVDAGGKTSTFTVTLAASQVLARPPAPLIHQQSSGTDFLVFAGIGGKDAPLAVRLNSQHVPDLINRAEASTESVFAWDAQHQQEPAFVAKAKARQLQRWRPSATDPGMSIDDANGMYLRELFFHVPHLIASRLHEEERYDEARRWLALIFDPYRKREATEHPGQDYWKCAWLMLEDTAAPGLEHELSDPHVIALHAPSHYRKAIFIQYVTLLIDQADSLYRQQTRDSLAQAWLLYRMAIGLMGEAPQARSVSTWQSPSVSQLLDASPGDERLLGLASVVEPSALPKHLNTFFWAGVAVHPAFRLPVNQKLLDTWQLLDARLYNLRHFLTLDGQPMELPLYAPAADPFDLLAARMSGGSGLSRPMGNRTVVPPYRFRTLVLKAHEAVAALIQFGEQLRSYMELEERTQQEVLQFRHAAQIAQYAIAIQEQLHEQQKHNAQVLQMQRTGAEQRVDHFSALYEENVTVGEVALQWLHTAGRATSNVASAAIGSSYLTDLVPKIFGLANGGMEYKGPLMALGYTTEVVANIALTASDNLRDTETWRRRRQEWDLQRKTAQHELRVIDKQLEAQQHGTLAAERALAHSRQLLAQAEQTYTFYQNRSSNEALYRWLRSQATAWHSTLFDVAVSLCNSAEACWQYETGQYQKRVIRPPVWQADRLGLNAGGELRLDLMRLESEMLLRGERHLEVRKTVSLHALLELDLVTDKAGTPLDSWSAIRNALTDDGEISLTLSQRLFDLDYPGHYLRRLHSVALSLPALLGPYQNIRATLAQKRSRLLIRPDIEGVKFLHGDADVAAAPQSVMMSLRAQQQVCLSSAQQDMGLVSGTDSDDRYLPFEGTGAVSDWTLRFPRHAQQGEMIESLSDVVLEVRYYALHGGAAFEDQVEQLLCADASGAAPEAAQQGKGRD